MIFSKKIVKNSRSAKNQWQTVIDQRNAYAVNEQAFAPQLRAQGLTANVGMIPQDVYREFDNVTVERMRSDDGDTFLNDLLPVSRSVNIGREVYKYRMASDAGAPQTSMSGQTGVNIDQVQYKYGGTLIPVHDTAFSRNWREWNAQQAEGFDALVDDARESVASLRKHIATMFLEGAKNKDGDFIEVDGTSWKGLTTKDTSSGATGNLQKGVQRVVKSPTKPPASSKNKAVDVDFAAHGTDDETMLRGMREFRDTLWIENDCERDLTIYTSREIFSNMERWDKDGRGFKLTERIGGIGGVAAIKPTSMLKGNQMMAFPLDGNSVHPVVGMGVNTVAMPRPVYNSNYTFVVWAAIGFAIKPDYSGKNVAAFFSGTST